MVTRILLQVAASKINWKAVIGVAITLCFVFITLFLLLVSLPGMMLFSMLGAENPGISELADQQIAIVQEDCRDAIGSRLGEWIADERARLWTIPVADEDIAISRPEGNIDYQDVLILYSVLYGPEEEVVRDRVGEIADRFLHKATQVQSVSYSVYENGAYVTRVKSIAEITITLKAFDAVSSELEMSNEQRILAAHMFVFVHGQANNPASFTGNEAGYFDGDYTFQDGQIAVRYFHQRDERWHDHPYDRKAGEDIGTAGCGPTALSIVVSSLLQRNVLPTEIGDWSYKNGYVAPGQGSYHSLIPAAAEHYGLTVESAKSLNDVHEALEEGKLIIAIMGPGHFTPGGHFIVLRGITAKKKILVADPVSMDRSQQEWDLALIWSEVNRGAGNGGPMWVIR